MNYADLVEETTEANSTVTIALLGAAAGYRSFAAGFNVGSTEIPVCVRDGAGNFEIGLYTLTSSALLTRNSLVSSSNGGAAVTFPAGSKTVVCTLSAAQIAKMVTVDCVATSDIANAETSKMFMEEGGVPKRLSIADMLAELGQTPDQLAPAGTVQASDIVTVFRGGAELKSTVSDLAAAIAIINGAPDSSKPTLVSAVIANAARSDIVLTFSEILGDFTPDAAAFAPPGGKTITGVARSGASITLTADSPYAFGDSGTIDYTKPGVNQLRDVAGNEADSFAGVAVTNNIAAPTAATGVTMSGPTGGPVSVESTNFSVGVTPVGGTITGTVAVVPSDSSGGGTFTPASVNLTDASPTATFTYTPGAEAGERTISVTNNAGLANPANITYTSTAVEIDYAISGNAGNVVKATCDGTTPTSTQGSIKGFTYVKQSTTQYWRVESPTAASVRCGWSQSNTVPPAEITSAQNIAGSASINGLAPMTAAASPSWNNDKYLWVPSGSGTTTWYFWIKPINGIPECMNPSGMTVTGA